MLSLVPANLHGEPTSAPTTPSPMQKISVQAISLRDALLVGIVTGFAYSVGALVFKKLSKRLRWD